MKVTQHLQKEEVIRCLELTNQIKAAARHFFERNGFVEFDTPVLTFKNGELYNPTFNVMVDGESLSLVDSPQIYKMLLMFAGCDRYYQFAHCFRPIAHENNKDTRICEFIQIDTEMHVENLDNLIDTAKTLLENVCKELNVEVKFHIIDGIWCRSKFGVGMKPDIRERDDETSIVIIKHMPLTNGERTADNILMPNHHIFAKPDEFSKEKDLMNITTESFDLVMNGIEIGGGDMRITDVRMQEKMMDIFAVDMEKYRTYLNELADYDGKPIGGFAIGLQRFVMALTNTKNIRETVAFPDWR